MRLLEKLKAQSPLVLDGGLATTLEQAGCSLKTSLWSSEVLKNNPTQIKQAHQAFQNWKKVDAHERSAKLAQWAQLIDDHQDELARLITLEGGKPLAEAKGEVAYDKATADALGYTDGRVNFALIRITSDSVKRVEYDKETQKGFYCKITNFYGTDKESVVVKHGGFSSGNETTKQTTYFLYQGVDNTVRTLTLEISFDGTEENVSRRRIRDLLDFLENRSL